MESGDITLNNPTKEGYEFTGWTGSNGYSPSKSVTIQSGKTGDLSFTANWELATYSITYNLDGGTVATANPTSYNYFTDTFTLNNPTRVGYTFLGWTGSNGSTAQTTVTVEQGSAGDLTYAANWEVISYKVYIDLDGGTDYSTGLTAENMTVLVDYSNKYKSFECTRNYIYNSATDTKYDFSRLYKNDGSAAGFTSPLKSDISDKHYVYFNQIIEWCEENNTDTFVIKLHYGLCLEAFPHLDPYDSTDNYRYKVRYYDVLGNQKTSGTIATKNADTTNFITYVKPGTKVEFLYCGGECDWEIYDKNTNSKYLGTNSTGNGIIKSDANSLYFYASSTFDASHNFNVKPQREYYALWAAPYNSGSKYVMRILLMKGDTTFQ